MFVDIKTGFVYIMSNKRRTTFYVGVTSNLLNRISQHKEGIGSIFTSKYKCFDLVYYEQIFTIEEAIKRETQLKNWKRNWKLELILKTNPELKDLSNELL